jgi:hypothetical protein
MHFFSKSLTRNHIDIPQNNSHVMVHRTFDHRPTFIAACGSPAASGKVLLCAPLWSSYTSRCCGYCSASRAATRAARWSTARSKATIRTRALQAQIVTVVQSRPVWPLGSAKHAAPGRAVTLLLVVTGTAGRCKARSSGRCRPRWGATASSGGASSRPDHQDTGSRCYARPICRKARSVKASATSPLRSARVQQKQAVSPARKIEEAAGRVPFADK